MTVTAQRPALAEQRSPRPSVPARMPHLGGLDGVRAIAVAGVVIYHLGAPWMRGGFLGVDVFFVLSGFLITTLVLDEVERTGGFSFRRFYARRARRLLPALGLLLVAMGGVAVAMPSEAAELRGDIAAAATYVSNWWQVFADRSYFEMVSRPPLLQHLWSLAIEEQFYLVFPLVVVVALRAGRARVGQVAGVLALLSTVAMAVLAIRTSSPVPNDPSRVYFGTDTHSMGLLVGAAMATAWTPWRTWDRAGSWFRERGRAVRRFEAGVTDVARGPRAGRGRRGVRVGRRVQRARCTAAASSRSRCWPRCSSGRSRTPPGCSGARSAASRGAGSVSGPTASTCGTGPCFMLSRPGVDLDMSPVAGHDPAAGGRAGHRRALLPVRRAPGPPGTRWAGRSRACVGRTRTGRAPLLRVVAAAVGLAVVGGVATAALAQVPRVSAATPGPGSPRPCRR